MVFKRSMAVLAALLVVVAVGCGSSKSSDGGSSDTAAGDTSPTLPYGATTRTTLESSSETTPPPYTTDDAPVVRAPDIDAFCAAFADVQTLTDTFGSLDFTNGLGILAAPAQARAAAHKMRETVPDAIQQSTDAYAVIVDQAGQAVGRADNLRRLNDAVGMLASAQSNPDVKPTFDWVVKNCTGP